MPRPRRLNLPDIPQHVTQRGNNRQACFFDDHDRETYLSLLGKTATRRECLVHGYVLMTNHVHLLVTPTIPEGVSTMMQDIGREYVRYINFRHRRSGTLWEGRFKSSLVESNSYCLLCYRYIELNPVRAKMVVLPWEYRWSSHLANARGHLDCLITPHSTWLELGLDHRSRFQAYQSLFDEVLSAEKLEAIRHSNRKGLPLGDDHFKAGIESQLGIKLGTGKVGRPVSLK